MPSTPNIKLGRLRQWAGEVISSREKTSVNEEFTALEKDIELRKDGINKIITASEAYHRGLTKKETSEALKEDEKLLPIDTLGIIMIQHGGQFGEDSTFGNALVKLGGAQCKIATLQEAYALTFKDTFLASMEKFRDEIKEYEALRKKLDSRKCAADSAAAKFEKLQNGKKEKDMTEAQDEMERMKQRYEETVEDLRAYMHAIQENELNQLQQLTALIDTELNFVQSYLGVLKEVKADFQENISTRHACSRNRSQTIRSAQYPKIPGNDSADSIKPSDDSHGHGTSYPKSEARHSRSNSNGSIKSNKSGTRSRKRTNSATASMGGTAEDKDKSKRMSMAEWASTAMESVTGGGGKPRKNKSDKDSFSALDDSFAESQPGEFGVAGRPSSSFLSITRLASKATGSGGSSKESSPGIGPPPSLGSRTPGKILKPQSMQRRKTVMALHDFTGSSDELSFKAGTEIIVLNEVLDDWWMGEVDGQTGLFPTSYTEVAAAKSSPRAFLPPSLSRSSAEHEPRRRSLNGRRSNSLTPKHRPVSLPTQKHGDTAADHGNLTSDADDDETRELSRLQPMMVNAKSPVYYDGFDNDSETDGGEVFEPKRKTVVPSTEVTTQSGSGDNWVTFDEGHDAEREGRAQSTLQRDEKQRQTPSSRPSSKQRTMSLLGSLGSSLKVPVLDSAQQPLLNCSRSKSEGPSISHSIDAEKVENGSPTKKAPPPPPPRKQSQTPSILPPIPVRKVLSTPNSSGNLPLAGQSPNLLPRNSVEIVRDRSPFDSVTELHVVGNGAGFSEGRPCDRFRQNPFKQQGICSNCLQFHDE